MNTYSIETDGKGGFEVRVTPSNGDSSYLSGDFPNWRTARDWIDADKSVTDRIAPPPVDQ
jgi:hypothetical protein